MKHSAKTFVIYRQYSWEEKGQYIIDSHDYRKHPSDSHVFVSEIEVEFDAPENYDPRPQMIDALKHQRQEIQADAHMKCMKIDEAIQQLLALENKVEA